MLLAAGDGRRVGHDTNKVLLPLAGRRVFTWGFRWAGHLAHINHRVLVIREVDREVVRQVVDREVHKPGDVLIVPGGQTRHGSEWMALQALAPFIESGEVDVVVIHDAARPLAATSMFADVIVTAARHGGAIPVRDQRHLATAENSGAGPSERVVAVQTPQAFLAKPLLDAYRQADRDGFLGTDTAACFERYTDLPVMCTPGDARNVKITFPEDLFLAERLLAKSSWDLSGHSSSADVGVGLLPHLRELWRGHR